MSRREPLLTLPFVLVFAASFLFSLSFMAYLHLPGFLQELGADETTIGIIFGTASASAIPARPWLGRAMDVRGRRVVLLVGGALNVLACLLYLGVDSLGPYIYGVRVVHGLAGAACFSVTFTIAADIVPPKRLTEGIAIFGVSGMLPISLGGVLGDLLLANGTYAELFVATAALAGGALLVSVPIRDSTPARADGVAPARGFLRSVLEPDLMPLWFVGVGFAGAITVYFTFLKTFVGETGIGSVGLFFTAYACAAIALRVFLGWVPDRFGQKRVLIPSLLLNAAGIVLLGFSGSDTEMAIAGVLCGTGHGYAFPIISALVVQRARAAERGTAMSAFTALFDVGVLIGSPIFGAVIDRWSYPPAFVAGAATLVVILVVFLRWDRGRA